MPEEEPSLYDLLFKNLHFSISQLMGCVIGAAVSVPITQKVWGFFNNVDQHPLDALWLGLYTLAVSVTGTWFFLGLFGREVRRSGGDKLQFVVQVIGISLTALIGLPAALFFTFVVMVRVGAAKNHSDHLNKSGKP